MRKSAAKSRPRLYQRTRLHCALSLLLLHGAYDGRSAQQLLVAPVHDPSLCP